MRKTRGRRGHLSLGWASGCACTIGLAALAACAADSSAPPGGAPQPVAVGVAAVIEKALADAEQRTGLPRHQLKVESAESVTWPDGSLGCPEPGMAYAQALVPGFRVKIRAAGELLDYHAGRGGTPTLCPAERARDPLPDGDPTR